MTTTSPYLPAAQVLIKGSHEQRVTLTLTDGTDTWTTSLLTGDLTVAEDWSPRAQLHAAIPNIFNLEELAAIDPREHTVRATINAGYIHPDGTEDVEQLFTGHLRERRVQRPSNVVQLEAWSDEGLVQDASWLAVGQFKTFVGVTEALEWFAGYALGTSVTIDSSVGNTYRADLTGSIPVEPGQNIWDIMAELALAANIRLYVDADGTWKIRAKVTEASVTEVTELANPSDSDDVLARNGYYSAAVLKYSWTDAGSVSHTIYGKYGTLPGRVYTSDLDTATTQLAADAAAQATLANLSTRGDSFVCTNVAAYWLRPESTVQVSLASGVEAAHLVKQVVFHLTSGTMTTTTRQPSNLGT
jgi:hypothetical protein